MLNIRTCKSGHFGLLNLQIRFSSFGETEIFRSQALAKLDSELETASASLREKQLVYDEANSKLKVLQADLATKKSKKAELENEVETCSRKLERAEQLIGGLGGERDKWAVIVGNLGTKFVRLTGDVLLASALVAYLGSFSSEARNTKLKEWMEKCKEHAVPFSEDFSLYNVLGDPITTQAWQLCGLPTDEFSTDNGIITFTAKRWVCMMDPQEIGKKWIQAIEKNNNLQILRQTDSEFLRSLESSIQFGQPALLENVGDTLDPILEPLLTKQTSKQGGSVCLKLGDSTLEYHKDFRLYITTKLKNPRFARDTVSKVALVNFSITPPGLEEQLLTITVTRERPELEEERAQLTVQANDNRKQLRDIENKILEVLYSSKGNILEDENAIKILSSSKVLANEITEKQNIAIESRKKIDDSRSPYLQVASYAGVLFFAISELCAVNHMYQYSLNWFINLFCNSIDLAEKSEEIEERLAHINDHVTWTLYQTVCRGLFEDDRFLFSLLLCLHIERYRGTLTGEELLAFASIPESDDEEASNPLTHFDTEAWIKIVHVSRQLADFADLPEKVKADELAFKELVALPPNEVLAANFPGFPDISKFCKLVILKCLATVDLKAIAPYFVEEHLGERYTLAPLPDLGKAYAESSSTTPIAFILGETADPCEGIYELAEKLNVSAKRLQFLCLGEGRETQAEELLREGIQAGTWVILMNCHLLPDWLAKLESACEAFDEETANPDFRLWMTSVTTTRFPVPILQNCIKVAQEEAMQVKESLLRCQEPPAQFKAAPELYKRMRVSLALFHGVINERVHFKQVGWNQNYVFSRKNLKLALSYLLNSVMKNDQASIEAITYLISDCIYGSGMDDKLDLSTLQTTLSKFCCQEVVSNQEHALDQDGVYKVAAHETMELMQTWVESLPRATSRHLLGMAEPVSRERDLEAGEDLLKRLASTQGLTRRRLALTSTAAVLERVGSILQQLPESFDLPAVEAKLEKLHSLNIVLVQELGSCNKLIKVARTAMVSCQEAIQGRAVLGEEVEEILQHVKHNTVLDQMKRLTYPTTFTLDQFVVDLAARASFLGSWASIGLPANVPLSAITQPTTLLTAIVQEFARANSIDFSLLSLHCTIDPPSSPPSGSLLLSGLSVVGALWDSASSCLVDLGPKSPTLSKLPPVLLVPSVDPPSASVYSCPVFRTPDRRGASNLAMVIDIPVPDSPNLWVERGVAFVIQSQ